MKKRRFSSEFKREVVQLARDSGKSITQVARELGLGVSLLAKWVREAQAAETKSGKKPDADEELRAARKEIARLKMEVEILGKAAVHSTGHRNTTTSDSWPMKVVTHAGSTTRFVSGRKSGTLATVA